MLKAMVVNKFVRNLCNETKNGREKMEGKQQKENTFSLYCEKLLGEPRERYLEKMEYVNGLDPYEIPTNELTSV